MASTLQGTQRSLLLPKKPSSLQAGLARHPATQYLAGTNKGPFVKQSEKQISEEELKKEKIEKPAQEAVVGADL